MSLEIRPATYDDAEEYLRVGHEAFGGTPAPVTPESWEREHLRRWVAYDGGTMVARLGVWSFTSWFHGRPVPTAGVGGVAVRAEHRGAGVLRPLVDRALAVAHEQGAVISTLYPTAAGVYRGLGYEVIGSFDTARVPMAALAAVRAPERCTVRRATAADVPAIQQVYDAWAGVHNGPLTRSTAPFAMTADDLFAGDDASTAVTLAVDGDRVLGFACWHRGEGYDRTGALRVDDLVALSPDAARALWRTLGSHATVIGEIALATSGGWTGADPSRLVLPDHAATVASRPYMLRVLDVAGALAALPVPDGAAPPPLSVVDPTAPDLEYDGGTGPVFTSRGLAAAWSGAMSTASLRMAGLLTGPATYDAAWDALWRGRDVHVRDYF